MTTVLLRILALAGTALAAFPNLSGFPSNTTGFDLSGLGITSVPAGAFARFSALQIL
jgi:hypothetical protein